MESNITYKGEIQELVEDYIDVGYMGENFQAQDREGNLKTITRSNAARSMTLIVSAPFFTSELARLDAFMNEIQVDIACYMVFDAQSQISQNLQKFEQVFDVEDEFGVMYGTKIVQGNLEGKLTKALFLISKDGAVFYIDMPWEIESEFDLQRLHVELNKAYSTYTGVGCHG
jgi:peroxiredoxin